MLNPTNFLLGESEDGGFDKDIRAQLSGVGSLLAKEGIFGFTSIREGNGKHDDDDEDYSIKADTAVDFEDINELAEEEEEEEGEESQASQVHVEARAPASSANGSTPAAPASSSLSLSSVAATALPSTPAKPPFSQASVPPAAKVAELSLPPSSTPAAQPVTADEVQQRSPNESTVAAAPSVTDEKREEAKKEKEDADDKMVLEEKEKQEASQEETSLLPLVSAILSGSGQELSPRSVRKVCSTLKGPRGPILKFSEIFAPPAKTPYKSRTKGKRRGAAATAVPPEPVENIQPEKDEEELFDQTRYVLFMSEEQLAKVLGFEETDEMDEEEEEEGEEGQARNKHNAIFGEDFGFSLFKPNENEAQQYLEQHFPLKQAPAPFFLPVQQTEWEKSIIWDDDDIDRDKHAALLLNSQKEIKSAVSLQQHQDPQKDASIKSTLSYSLDAASRLAITKKQWGTISDEPTTQPEQNNNSTPPLHHHYHTNNKQTLLSRPDELPPPSLVSIAAASPTPTTPSHLLDEPSNNDLSHSNANANNSQPDSTTKGQHDLFALHLNNDLETGEWLEGVIWDDRSVPPKAYSQPLILDLNDKNMLFEEDTTSTSTASSSSESGAVDSKQQAADDALSIRRRRPKRNMSEIESIIEQEIEENLDPFNLSQDRMYVAVQRNQIRSKSLRKSLVQHSLPALKLQTFKTHLTPEELRDFHRPKTKFPPCKKIKISPTESAVTATNSSGKRSKRRQSHTTIRRVRDLTGKDGRVVLMEYMEERPPLLMNIGMGTKIRNFFRKQSSTDLPPYTCEDGETVILEPTDDSPFLGDVGPGEIVQGLDSNLFKAPIMRHDPPMTDFLLIRSKDKRRAYIREIPAVYAVGQQQPLVKVPAPNSRSANNFMKNRLQTFIYRLFKKRSTSQQRLRISDVCSAFPNQSETAIRKRLKDCADFQRGGDDSGWWTVKEGFELPSEEDLRKMLAPEKVCAYESMQAGQQYLADIGIENITNTSGLSTVCTVQKKAVRQVQAEIPRLKEAANKFQEELLLTPWHLTSNFVSVMHGKGQLQLEGFGDPTGRGDGFSYMKVPIKSTQGTSTSKQTQSKLAVTGTDADLRKLSLENSRLVLLKFGVADEAIQKLTRWERIDLVRKKSSAAAASASGDDPMLTKFARGARHNIHQQQQQYKDDCQRIFERQLRFLSQKNPEVSDDEEETLEGGNLEELEDFVGALEGELMSAIDSDANTTTTPSTVKTAAASPKKAPSASRLLASKKRRKKTVEVDEEADKKEFEKFMEESLEAERKAAAAAAASGSASALSTTVTPSASLSTIAPSPTTPAATTSAPSPVSAASLAIKKEPKRQVGATPTAAPKQKVKKRKVIKRTVTKKNADGTTTKVVEYIKDPELIEKILSKKNKKPATGGSSYVPKRPRRPKLTAEEEEKRNLFRKEKRRLQEQLRRLKKNREKQKALTKRLETGNLDGTLPTSGITLQCGACGMIGHMRTNRNCPYFKEPSPTSATPAETPSTAASTSAQSSKAKHVSTSDNGPTATTAASGGESGLVKVEGTKIRFSKMVLPSLTIPPSPSPATTTAPTPSPSSPLTTEAPKKSSLILRISRKDLGNSLSSLSSSTSPSSTASTTPTTDSTTPKSKTKTTTRSLPQTNGLHPPSSVNDKTSTKIGKRKREISEPSYMLHPPKVSRRRLSKSGRGAGVELCNLLERAWNKVSEHNFAAPFREPVNAKLVPDYYKVIKRPMDLKTIKTKLQNFKYHSRGEFLDDMKLMVANCHQYNDVRNPGLPPLADVLLQICEDAILEMDDELTSLEQLIHPEGTSSTTTPTTTKPRGGASKTIKKEEGPTPTPTTTPGTTIVKIKRDVLKQALLQKQKSNSQPSSVQ
ncbi:Transcription initiation factor TFIID subunit 1 [Balamuthia mandrillaris]